MINFGQVSMEANQNQMLSRIQASSVIPLSTEYASVLPKSDITTPMMDVKKSGDDIFQTVVSLNSKNPTETVNNNNCKPEQKRREVLLNSNKSNQSNAHTMRSSHQRTPVTPDIKTDGAKVLGTTNLSKECQLQSNPNFKLNEFDHSHTDKSNTDRSQANKSNKSNGSQSAQSVSHRNSVQASGKSQSTNTIAGKRQEKAKAKEQTKLRKLEAARVVGKPTQGQKANGESH